MKAGIPGSFAMCTERLTASYEALAIAFLVRVLRILCLVLNSLIFVPMINLHKFQYLL